MAREAGIAERRLWRAVREGSVIAVARGAYFVPDGEPDSLQRYQRRVEALLLGRPDAVLAGVTAAAWWGLPCPEPWGDWTALPVVMASKRPVHHRPGLVRLVLHDRVVTMAEGRAVTDLATTAVDVARQMPEPPALMVVDAVARRLAGTSDRGLLAGDKARERTRAILQQSLQRSGVVASGVRAARTIGWADPAAESPPESFIRGHVLAAGLRPPLVNPRVTGISGRRYYVDLFWPDAGCVLEIDGKLKYDDVAVIHREKLRQEDIEATGLRVSRWMAADILARPGAVVGGLRSVL